MKIYTNEELKIRKKRTENRIQFLKLILLIMIVLCILYNVCILAQSFIMPDKTPSCFGYKTFSIISGSMIPELNVGDVIIVKEINEEELQVNDIIAFRANSEIITHRIINIEEINGEKRYTTKGDNNDTEDIEKVKYTNIEGKVINKINKIGYLITILRNRITILILTIIFIVLYGLDLRNNNKKLIREKKREIFEKEHREDIKK